MKIQYSCKVLGKRLVSSALSGLVVMVGGRWARRDASVSVRKGH